MSLGEGRTLISLILPVFSAYKRCTSQKRDMKNVKKKPDSKFVCFVVALNYVYACASELECVHEFSCPWRPEEGIGSPGAGVTGTCELRINSGPLPKEYTLLTTEPSLQPLGFLFLLFDQILFSTDFITFLACYLWTKCIIGQL